ncbi:MAG: acyl-CoA thioesterase [Candidatus Kapabacteria bacterium]|nr:acyl-CoA thioesterase [Candidatus Kapabacteria bacterium]
MNSKNNQTQKLSSLADEISLFKHKFTRQVEFSQVDSFGVVHNLQYFYFLEWARTDYLRAIGLNLNPMTFLKEYPIMTVHSEIDYFAPLKFNDIYIVLTRVEFIKNSSLGFKNLILNDKFELIIKGSSILVNVNPKTLESVRIPEDFRQLIKDYEGDNVKFLD